jgi:hypothetical protein
VHDSLVNFGLRRTLRAATIEKNHFGGNQHPVDVNFRQVGFRITSNSVVAANLLLNQRPPQLSGAYDPRSCSATSRVGIFGRALTVWMFCATGAHFWAVLFTPPKSALGESCRSSAAKARKIRKRVIAGLTTS